MRKALIQSGIVVFGALLAAHTTAQACGDALLSLLGGVRAQRAYAAARPATIMLYVGRNSSGQIVALQSTLKSAGHKVHVVQDAAQAELMLRSERFDLVLADISEAGALSQQTKAVPSKPTVLPLMYRPTKPERAAAEKQFGLVLSAPGSLFQYLSAIDQAMKRRATAAHT